MQGTFELNGNAVVVSGISPTKTLLEWLRENGHTGTKEGCAEGDCGACTIAILDNESVDSPRWRSVCSCILLLPQIFNKSLVTVEGLAQGDVLHPAQSAMVDALGSQCGYCTPGFVMSLFEATYRDDLIEPWQKDDQICGNLCRCTGYRPIRDALEEVAGKRPNDQFLDALSDTGTTESVRYEATEQVYTRPSTWSELWPALAADDAKVINGSTDLGLHVTQHHKSFSALVDLGGLPELRRIEETDAGFRIGASVLLSDLEEWSAEHLPALTKMLRFFASRQIKNRATLGGNLCNASPIGDLPPVMLGLDAVAVIRSSKGQRRVPFGGLDPEAASFWVDYRQTTLSNGEILEAVEIPKPHPMSYIASYKVSKRRELDISAVASTFAIRLDPEGKVDHIRLAYGGMAATPLRAYEVESFLYNKSLDAKSIEQSVALMRTAFTPMTDHRGSAWYRATVASNLLRGFFLERAANVSVGLPNRPTATILSGGAP